MAHMKTPVRSFRRDFEAVCAEHSHARAILDAKTGRVWTYGALGDAARGAAALLARAGVRPGGRVLSILPNGVEQFACFLGAWLLGADFCPVSPLSTPQEAERFAKLCGCAVALVPQQLEAGLAGRLEQASRRKALLTFTLDGDLSRLAEAAAAVPESSNGGRLILFTSGTVAAPKAIVINADRLWSSAKAWAGHHPALTSDSRFYNILPMSYLGGLFNLGLIPLACGGSFVLSDAFSGVTALKFWREILAHGINTLWLAPTMLQTLLTLHKPDPEAQKAYRQVRLSFLGMAPCALALKEKFEKTFGIPLLENFALSETTFLSSERLGGSVPRSAGSTGQVLPWVDLKLESKGDGVAELLVKTPFLFEGYLQQDGRVELPTSKDGYFATGDLGALEDGATLVIKGRSREIVKKGGYLLVLRELEEAALDFPAVAEAAAVGVPHDFYGETAVMFVRLAKPDAVKQSLDDLAKHLMRSLAKFKWPGELVAVGQFPKTESGKTQKRLLLEGLKAGQGTLASTVLK